MQADSNIFGSEDDELLTLVHTVKNDILPDIKCRQLLRETQEGTFSRYSLQVKKFVMELDENSRLVEMRRLYDITLKRNKKHNKNMDELKNLFLSGGLSLEEALIKFGGDSMKDVPKNDLDEIVSKLTESPEIMLPAELKSILFKQWEDRLKKVREVKN